MSDRTPEAEAAHREPEPRTTTRANGAMAFPSEQDRGIYLINGVEYARAAQPAPAVAPDRDGEIAAIAAALRPGHVFEHDGGLDTCPDRDPVAALEQARELYDVGLRPAPSAPSSGDSLDEAWHEAEAALPPRHGGLVVRSIGDWGAITGYHAFTFDAGEPTIIGTGPTPAAALHALAARLRAAEPAGEPEGS